MYRSPTHAPTSAGRRRTRTRAVAASVFLAVALTSCAPASSDPDTAADVRPDPAAEQAIIDQLTLDDAVESDATATTPDPAASDAPSANAKATQTSGALHLVMDVSGSMSGRLDLAKDAVTNLIRGLDDRVAVGLRSYSGSCGSAVTSPDVPIAPANDAAIEAALTTLRAGGGTPTADAVLQGLAELESWVGDGPRRLVVVTDGDNDCPQPICEIVRTALGRGTQFSLYAVGLGTSAAMSDDLRCAAQESGGDSIVVSTPEELNDALEVLVPTSGWTLAWNPIPGWKQHHDGVTTVAASAGYQSRQYGTSNTTRSRSDLMIVETLNLAAGLPHNRCDASDLACSTAPGTTGIDLSPHTAERARHVCGEGTPRLCTARWKTRAPEVADAVVDDLERLASPSDGSTRRPAVSLLVQEARPVLVQEIAEELAARFGTQTYTVFSTVWSGAKNRWQEHSSVDGLNAGHLCNDLRGELPASYRCEYGNAVISTVPVYMRGAVRFAHREYAKEGASDNVENRVLMIVDAVMPNGEVVGLANTHLQDAKNGKGTAHRRGELELTKAALREVLSPRAVVGGDFNQKDVKLGLFLDERPTGRPIDKFFDRLLLRVRAEPGGMHRYLDVPGVGDPHSYKLDHGRVVSCWSLDIRQVILPSTRCADRPEIR